MNLLDMRDTLKETKSYVLFLVLRFKDFGLLINQCEFSKDYHSLFLKTQSFYHFYIYPYSSSYMLECIEFVSSIILVYFLHFIFTCITLIQNTKNITPHSFVYIHYTLHPSISSLIILVLRNLVTT